MTRTVTREKTLAPKQFRGIAILVSGGSVADAAEAANCTKRTIHRWMEQPEFREELQAAETETIRAASRRMTRLVENALGVIESVLSDPEATDHVRLRAATIILETTLKWREATNFEERLRALEDAFHAK